MYLAAIISFLSFSSVVLAGNLHSRSTIHRRHSTNSTCVPRPKPAPTGKTYTLTDMYQGQNFFDDWDFFSASDPTHGNVQYLDQGDATSKGLAYVQSDNVAVMAVDDYSTIPVGGQRPSVRVSTKKTYNGGLFIGDFAAMPFGCGTWPAWWSVSGGSDWPTGGEIDVLEGVNTNTNNQMTLHTAPGCTLSTSPPSSKRDAYNTSSNSGGSKASTKAFTATVLGTQCESSNANNDGCAFQDADTRSYGEGFNNAGGGVFAHTWDATGIKVWFFSRNEIPQDITSQNPNPSGWGTPSAFWSSTSCNMAQHFYNHVLTIDTTLCGDWAGNAYSGTGCPGTCAQAIADPSNFSNAKWKINYIAVYN